MQLEHDQAGPHAPLFNRVRELLLSLDGVQETKKERITTYSCHGAGLCHLRTMPHGIDVGFLKGAFLEDSYELLRGDSKRMRVLPLSDYAEEILLYYITQAVALNR